MDAVRRVSSRVALPSSATWGRAARSNPCTLPRPTVCPCDVPSCMMEPLGRSIAVTAPPLAACSSRETHSGEPCGPCATGRCGTMAACPRPWQGGCPTGHANLLQRGRPWSRARVPRPGPWPSVHEARCGSLKEVCGSKRRLGGAPATSAASRSGARLRWTPKPARWFGRIRTSQYTERPAHDRPYRHLDRPSDAEALMALCAQPDASAGSRRGFLQETNALAWASLKAGKYRERAGASITSWLLVLMRHIWLNQVRAEAIRQKYA